MGPRIRALDGWRGIAILMVILSHYPYRMVTYSGSPLWTLGQHGVTVFFVLSGYLITSKLIERDIDLRRFYVRRFFRLMPVAWVYLLSLVALHYLLNVQYNMSAGSVPALFFYRNFCGDQHALTNHFWSLSVEEQFYLVWPGILSLFGKRKALWFSVAGAIGCATYRLLHWSAYNHLGPDTTTQVRADALFIGCILALVIDTARGKELVEKISRFTWPLALLVLAFCSIQFPCLPPLPESVAIAVLIAACVLHPQSKLARALSFRPLAWLGVISYSVYVWQQLFFLPDGVIRWLPIVGIPLMGAASYYLIEKKGIEAGRKLLSRPGFSIPLTSP